MTEGIELDPIVDLVVDAANLNAEFRRFSLILYRYTVQKADVEKQRDLAKAKLKEVKALAYKRIKGDISVKHTEKSMEAEIETDPHVLKCQNDLIDAEHQASTVSGAVDSMKAKKDCLIQLGADSRKER